MNEVQEKQILFTGEMVRAILAGRKTMTRRVIKPQPTDARCCVLTSKGEALFFQGTTVESPSCDGAIPKCPYGLPGGHLWVRETWHLWGPPERQFLDYAATNPEAPDLKWQASIHMPRWASRITLEMTNLRVERLKQISLEDVEAEGTPQGIAQSQRKDGYARIQEYKVLWNGINEKRGFGWEANPWVWVIEFRRLKPAVVGP